MAKPDFSQLSSINILHMHEYEHYLPTAFDESLSLLQKVNKMLLEMNKMGLVVNDFIKMWNKLLEWITNEGLEDMVEKKLEEWLKDGTLQDILNDLLGNYNPFENLPHQEVLTSVNNTENGEPDFIQGFSINQNANELYVVRKDETKANNIIYRYNLTTGVIKDYKRFTTTTGTYNEGLPYFYNGSGDLCFIVRTSYDHMVAIFNYTTGTLGTPFVCQGSSKHGMDDRGYYYFAHFGDANRTEGIFIYDFDSVVSGNPQLIRKVYFPNSIADGEKIQSMCIIDGLIFCGHGKNYPQVSVINFTGDVVHHHGFNKGSLLNMIRQSNPNITITSAAYENEGMFFYKENGKLYPVMAHMISELGRTYFTKMGNPLWYDVVQQEYTKDVNGGVTWKDVTDFGSSDVVAYGEDVKPQYCKDDKGFVELRGVLTYTRENTDGSASYTYNKVLFTLPYPYKPYRNTFYSTPASGGADRRSRLSVNVNGEVKLESVYDQGGDAKPFCVLDGIRFYCDTRPN